VAAKNEGRVGAPAMIYVMDSNIFIYAAAGLKEALRVLDEANSDERNGYSAITRLEVLGYKKFSENEERKLSSMLSCFCEYDVAKTIIDEAIRLRRASAIKAPDALIAATALLHDATLVTRNEEDFKNVSGLKILNPFG
jgi:toxin FitB